MKSYIGTVVEESLRDNRFLNELEILGVHISSAEKSKDRWHLYKVRMNKAQIQRLAKELKPEKWYAHFWDEQTIYGVFPNKTFVMSRTDKSTWQPAINFGLSLRIPREQLDFLIKE